MIHESKVRTVMYVDGSLDCGNASCHEPVTGIYVGDGSSGLSNGMTIKKTDSSHVAGRVGSHPFLTQVDVTGKGKRKIDDILTFADDGYHTIHESTCGPSLAPKRIADVFSVSSDHIDGRTDNGSGLSPLLSYDTLAASAGQHRFPVLSTPVSATHQSEPHITVTGSSSYTVHPQQPTCIYRFAYGVITAEPTAISHATVMLAQHAAASTSSSQPRRNTSRTRHARTITHSAAHVQNNRGTSAVSTTMTR